MASTEEQIIHLDGAPVGVLLGGEGALAVIAAHPVERFGIRTVALLAEVSGARVLCINPAAGRPTLEQMVSRIEAARNRLNLGRVIFWGMSGGGWLAQLYARLYPEALRGVVIESACACYRARLADPRCVLSPLFPAWREVISQAGLLADDPHQGELALDEVVWRSLDGVGEVLCRSGGPALLVSPAPLSPEMKAALPLFWRFDSRGWLSSLQLPALILSGSDDPVAPVSHAELLHRAIKGSSLVIAEGVGHVPTAAKHPAVVVAFQRFVAALS